MNYNRDRKNLNIILVSYSGYPEINSTWLHYDNGLALLGGSLIEKNHNVKILDFQRLDVWEELFPHDYEEEYFELKKELEEYSNVAFTKEQVDAKSQYEGDKLIDKCLEFDEKVDTHNRKVIDKLVQQIYKVCEDFEPDIIGFKLWGQNSLLDQFYMAGMLKNRYKNALLIGGGPAVEIYQEHIFYETSVFDILIYGPGEETILQIAELKAGKRSIDDIANIVYRNKDELVKSSRVFPHLDGISPYNYDEDVYLFSEYKLHNVHVESSRGCNFDCEFCVHPQKSGKLFLKSPELFVEDVARLNRKYGLSYFHLADSNPPLKHLANISKILCERELHYGFMCFQSLRTFNEEDLKWLKKANFNWFWIGVESGSDEVLENLSKKRETKKVKEYFELLNRYDILTTASIIVPSPYENDNAIMNTIQHLQVLKPDAVLFFAPVVQPKTKWFESNGQVIVKDKDAVIRSMIRCGMEWHTGNKLLPMVFHDDVFEQAVQYGGKSYKEIFFLYKHYEQMIRNAISGQIAMNKFRKIKNINSSFMNVYLQSQIQLAQAIRSAQFDKAKGTLTEFNEIAHSGEFH